MTGKAERPQVPPGSADRPQEPAAPPPVGALPVLQVEAPGPFTLVQDLGRTGRRAVGVPVSGAMDRFAIAAANLLVGNAESAAALECALAGPRLVALSSCVVAVTGRTLPEPARPAYSAEPEVGAMPGPHVRRLSARARRTFFRERWAVSRDSDRMGYRLEGPELEIQGAELLSFGLAMGCVQVPASGQPILLMADHQTAGGYPVVAGVARADLPLVAQLLPGDHLTFREVSVEAAQGEWRRLRSALDALRR